MKSSRKSTRPLFLACWILAVVALPLPSAAQTSVQMEQLFDRLDRLEGAMQEIQAQLFAGRDKVPAAPPRAAAAPLPPRSSANMEIRLSRLETQLRDLKGLLEEANHKADSVRQDLTKMSADLEFRFQEFEKRLAAGTPAGAAAAPGGTESQAPVAQAAANGPAASQAAATPAAPARLLPEGEPKEQYQFAYGLLRKLDYEKAEVAFKEFLEVNREDPLVGNAYFWLGQTYYVRKQYKAAAKAFLQGYNRRPEGPKAADSLFKLAATLGLMEQRAEACATLAELFRRFPKMERRVRGQAEREQKKLTCG